MKPRIRFLNYVHQPVFFKPVEWCITEDCARFFWPEDSKTGQLLKSGELWGWKEHATSMQIYFGCMVLDAYKYRYTEVLFGSSDRKLVCLHFSRRIEINHPPMPEFDYQDKQDEQDTPF